MANVKITDSNTVNLDTDGDAITAEVILNPDPNNLLSAGPDGLNAYYPLLSNPNGLNGTPPTVPGPLIWIDDSLDPECVMIWSCGSESYLPFGGPVGDPESDEYVNSFTGPDANGNITLTYEDGRPPESINILQYILSHSCTPEVKMSYVFPTPYTVANLGSGTDPDDPTPDCCPEVVMNYTFPNTGDTSDLLRAIVDQADQAARAYAYNLLSTA